MLPTTTSTPTTVATTVSACWVRLHPRPRVSESSDTHSASVPLDAPTTSKSSARYDLAQPLSQFPTHRHSRPKRTRSPSATCDRATERRKLLPRLNTAVAPALQVLPSPQSCSSPIANSDAAYIPSHFPPVRRETLKELDLEAILANVQLREPCLLIPLQPLCSSHQASFPFPL